jgi:L-histidine Nalpha-methyltransferase
MLAPVTCTRSQMFRSATEPESAHAAPLSAGVASELRDALRRRQKELPPRWLAALDATTLGDATKPAPGHAHEATERELALGLLETHLPDARPRGVVCIQPSASAASSALVESLYRRGSVTSVAATELDATLAAEMVERVTSGIACQSTTALACDCTVELPVPDNFPRPRVYLCLGNVLGSTTTVGAVRLLRVLRTTMSPRDGIVLGLDVRRDASSPDAVDLERHALAADRHLGVLELLNAMTGATFDPDKVEYRPIYDAENHRLETHLVARRAFAVEVPGICDVRFRKGESLRTSVRCVFDRNRVAAMLGGVGLMLREWTTDADATFVVALATPAV